MMPLKLTLRGRPITKKNHSQIVKVHNRLMVIPSKQYKAYEADCGKQITCKGLDINEPVNVKCLYYMPTHHRVDLCNLHEATCDILVKFRVLADDNSRIVAGHDGSRVLYDKDDPRVEITIEPMEENDEQTGI